VSLYREPSRQALDQVSAGVTSQRHLVELASMQQAHAQGEQLLADGKATAADRFFELVMLKAQLLQQTIAEEEARQAGALRREEEARRVRELLLEQQRQRELVAEQLRQAEAAAAEARRSQVRSRPERERLLLRYTVRRGETLPQIAAQPEIYGDAQLWPLIYRANRDQIRNPRVVWPGQNLKIPRNLDRADLAEARRYAAEKPLR
jgi:nucleoid-associated protein YgaU